MPRILLTAPTSFYAGVGGSLGNDGLSPAQALPTMQDVIDRQATTYDFGGQKVENNILDGSIDPGFRVSGIMVGQRGLSGLVVRQSSMGAAVVRPAGGSCAVALDSGAMLSIADLDMDGLAQAGVGKPQDLVQLGQGGRVMLWGSNRIKQNSTSYNGITLVGGATVDIQPQSWGSQIQNGGHLHWQGVFQDGIQSDQCANLEANCNGGHGLIAFWFENCPGVRAKPYWSMAFADPASGVFVMSGIDMHGTADGYKYRLRKFATLDVNQLQEPNVMTTWPGSADKHPTSDSGVLI